MVLLAFAEVFPEGRSPASTWVASVFAPSGEPSAKTVLPAEAIRDLAPLVPAKGGLSREWMSILRRGGLPTEEAVQQRMNRGKKRVPAAPTPAEMSAADGREAEVAGWVARYVEARGQWPLWREVFKASGGDGPRERHWSGRCRRGAG